MKQVVILIPEGKINLSSVTGTYEILSRANEHWKQIGNKPKLEIMLAGLVSELKADRGFFSIRPVHLRDVRKADLLIIPSLSHDYCNILRDNIDLIAWIREQYQRGAEIASICTGAFLVAATGLLDGKRCSTHWNAAEGFRRLFPNIQLEVDKLITAEPGIYTNGGAYSFLNLLLFLVEKYFDRPTAVYCSKIFQIEIERATQSPFQIFQAQKNHGDDVVQKAQIFLEEHINTKISFEKLASSLATSRRNFDRRFIKATGNTPVEYLQRVKIEVAKSALEKGSKSIFEVMKEVGYSDDKAFREVFRKFTGLTPLVYKAKFNRQEAFQ